MARSNVGLNSNYSSSVQRRARVPVNDCDSLVQCEQVCMLCTRFIHSLRPLISTPRPTKTERSITAGLIKPKRFCFAKITHSAMHAAPEGGLPHEILFSEKIY